MIPHPDDHNQNRSSSGTTRRGIKAQSNHGCFGVRWWSIRWVEVIESFKLGGELKKGQAYARDGRILSMTILPGSVFATVQGARSVTHNVKISIKELGDQEWTILADKVFGQALTAAKLLAGELPEDLEEQFDAVGATLFPKHFGDLITHCSCSSMANPCKHIAAVYYLLAEEFDRNPFLLLTLRGVTENRFLQKLGVRTPFQLKNNRLEETQSETMPPDHASFWGLPHSENHLQCPPTTQLPTTTAAVIKQLGSLPFWRGESPFQESMELIYSNAAKRAEAVLGDLYTGDQA